MKSILPFLFTLISFFGTAQIVSIEPTNATANDEVTIIYDATEGTGGLAGATSVYMHSGVITSGPDGQDWQFVIGNWGQDDGIGKMTQVAGESNLWEITLSPSIKDYYQVPDGQTIFRLAMVFRSADGSSEGKGTPGAFAGGEVGNNGDIYVNLDVGRFVSITAPTTDQFIVEGGSFPITIEASDIANSLEISINAGNGFETLATTANNSTLTANFSATESSEITVRAIASFPETTVDNIRTIRVNLRGQTTSATPPAGLKDGINYFEDDPTKVVLSLLAPKKEFVYVVGDFTNWEIADDYLMQQSSQDPDRFFLEINGLTPNQEYVFQYWVDGIIRVGDPFADKVADPWNDEFIPASVYPNLPSYDKTQYGIATVLQTGQEPYVWAATEETWQRPDQEELIIYELLVRDFVGSHDYKDLIDSLPYLKKLGINAIELLPIMEFEGNSSWGYNPSYFFAVDKYYGTKNDLKSFIEKCHQEGIAVILDMVLNHAFGQSPMVMMYFENGRPSSESPWFNMDATHPFNVGYDFNHESQYTKDFIDKVNAYWVEEFHFDGYRFDLSKGFTQKNNPNNVAAWGAYDQSRIDLLTRMANELWTVDSETYVILEHFADASEETVLKQNGMLVWGNSNHDFRQLLAGNDLPSTNAAAEKGRVSYMESHDEARLMYEMTNFGRSFGTYDTQDEIIALNRVKLASAFLFTLPGPKMLWQFQELGYDLDINLNGRTGEKPLPWGVDGLGYYEDEERQKLYKTTAAILQLVDSYREVFTSGTLNSSLSGEVRNISITHEDLEVKIVGNFSLQEREGSINFGKSGDWYEFFTGDTLTVGNPNVSVDLAPGQFYFYTDRVVAERPEPGLVSVYTPIVTPDPFEFSSLDEVTFIFDAAAADPDGTAGLVGVEQVFMYAGVVLSGGGSTSLSEFQGSLDGSSSVGELTKVAGTENKWAISITPRSYFGVNEEQRIYKIGMKFRDASGDKRGTNNGGDFIFFDLLPDEAFEIVTVSPEEFSSTTEITITYNAEASEPIGALVGADKVYMHSGVITSGETGTGWDNVVGNWGQDDGVGEMTKVPGESDLWQITIIPRSYYNVGLGTKIYRMGMVFRNAAGNREGKDVGLSDIFVNFPIVDEGYVTALQEERKFSLYPNPVRGELHIQLAEVRLLTEIHIINMSGQKIREFRNILPENGEFSIPMMDLKPGNYVILFTDGIQKYAAKAVKY